MKKSKWLLSSLAIVIVVLSIVRIVLSNAFSVDGITLDGLQSKIAGIERDNMLLSEKVYSLSSYTTIASEAASLGYVETSSQISIQGTQAVAIKQ